MTQTGDTPETQVENATANTHTADIPLTPEQISDTIASLKNAITNMEQDITAMSEDVANLYDDLEEIGGDIQAEDALTEDGMSSMMGRSGADKIAHFDITHNIPQRLSDVGGIELIKEELTDLANDLKNIHNITNMRGKDPKHRVLLQGPPGVGKTLLAKALAGETGFPMIMTSGSRFFESYVGKAREAVEKLFDTARKDLARQRENGITDPAFIIFIDEIETLVPRRGRTQGEGDGERVGEMLVQMDGKSDDPASSLLRPQTTQNRSIQLS